MQQLLYSYFNHPATSKAGKVFQFIIFANIVLSVTVLFLQTEDAFKEYIEILTAINTFTMVLFLIEYLLRIYASGADGKFRGFKGRVKFALTPFMFIDLLVILPFFLSFLGFELSFLRSLRFIRIFKLFRIAKFAEFDAMMVEIFKERKEEFLYILISSFFLLIVLSSIVYYFENPAQPEVFSSMSSTLWWAVITFTTVGYGDMYPITAGGKIVTTFTAVLGIAFYAIPGSIFTSSLLDKLSQRKSSKES